MSDYDITSKINPWKEALNNEQQYKQLRIDALIKKYGFPINENNLLPEDYYEYEVLKKDLEAMRKNRLATQPMPHGSSLDDNDMDKNAAIVCAKRETARADADSEILKRIRENGTTHNSASSQREKREQEIMDQVDDEIDNWSDDDWDNYIKKQSSTEQKAYKALHLLPEYRILVKNKAKMELAGRRIVNEFGSGAANGIDNLYHRRGMYEIGQRVHTLNLGSPVIGAGLGVLKELNDIYKKTLKGDKIPDVLLDSLKDMYNNLDGLNDGVNHFKSSREYYKNFDYKQNRKKK